MPMKAVHHDEFCTCWSFVEARNYIRHIVVIRKRIQLLSLYNIVENVFIPPKPYAHITIPSKGCNCLGCMFVGEFESFMHFEVPNCEGSCNLCTGKNKLADTHVHRCDKNKHEGRYESDFCNKACKVMRSEVIDRHKLRVSRHQHGIENIMSSKG